MKPERRASWMIHIVSIFCGVLAIGFMVLLFFAKTGLVLKGSGDPGEDFADMIGMGIAAFFTLGFIAVLELIAAGLKAYRKWAWIIAVIFFVTYLSSPLIIVGIVGLHALLCKKGRELYGVEKTFQSWTGSKKNVDSIETELVSEEKPKMKLGVVYTVAGISFVLTVMIIISFFL